MCPYNCKERIIYNEYTLYVFVFELIFWRSITFEMLPGMQAEYNDHFNFKIKLE
jgi:hypothetical protein